MDNKMNEVMANDNALPFNECYDNLCHTRDYSLYLDSLVALKTKYIIVLSIRDTSSKLPEALLNKIHHIGFTELSAEHYRMFIGISDRGSVIINKSGERIGDPLREGTVISGTEILVRSEPYGTGNSYIAINGDDYAMNQRGLNFVVYDFENKRVVDSSVYDQWVTPPRFYHRDLFISDAYFDSRFFINEKYIDWWTYHYKRSLFSNRRLGYRTIDNGIIEPLRIIDNRNRGGVCDEAFNFIAGHAKHSGVGTDNNEISASYHLNDNELDFVDETVIFGGLMFDHPGHLIVENIAEYLWFVLTHPELSYRIIVTISVSWSDEPGKFVKEFMDILNIPLERIVILDKATKFRQVIVPDPSIICDRGSATYEFTKEYVSVFDYIKKNVSPMEYKKLYLAKTKTARGNIIGEDFFIDFYESKGFKVLYPEDYTMREKVSFLFGADEVVTLNGTNNLFAIFCRPTVKLTILTRTVNGVQPCHLLVNQVAGIRDITIADVATGFLHRDFVGGISMMCVTDYFREYVKKIYNEELSTTPEESLKNNLYDYLKIFPEYYADPRYFNMIKNQNMQMVLQMMSEVFLGRDFDTSRLDLSTNETDLQKQVRDLTVQKNSLTSQISTLNEENKSIKSANALLEFENNQLHNEQNNLSAELLCAYREKDEINYRLTTVYAEKDTLVQRLSDVYRDKDELNQELIDNIKQADEMNQKLLDAKKQKEEISQKLSAMYQLKDEVDQKFLKITEEKAALLMDIDEKNYRIEELTSESKMLYADILKKASDIENAKNEADNFERKYEELKIIISQIQDSRSWRYTRIFRKNKKDAEI